MDRQQEFVLRTIEERDIRFVRLWFTDVLGTLKSVAVAPAELEGAFAEGIGFDGSAIEGFVRVYESDMLAKPDPSTFQVLPWRGERNGTARMFCDITLPDGTPSMADPRHVLQRALAKAADMGFTFYTHPEIEFYLLEPGWGEGRGPRPIDSSGYFDHTPHGSSADFRRAAITMLEEMGISVEFSHHEGGPGQNEIDLRYADALSTADNIMTFRTVVKEVALSQGIYASFMPKPFAEHPGSGMHTHMSLFEGDTNAFHEPGAPYQLSRVGRQFIAGLIHHGAELTAVTNQWVNSYKRLWGGERRPPTSRGDTTTAPLWSGCRCTSRTRATAAASRCAASTPRATPTSPSPCSSPRASRAWRRATSSRPRPRTTCGASPTASGGPWASSHSPRACRRRSRRWRRASWSPRPSASTPSTSSSATSARSGTTTATRSPPSSSSATCRACEGGPMSSRAPGSVPAAIARLGFADPRRALTLLTDPAIADVAGTPERIDEDGLSEALSRVADPDGALLGIVRFMEAAGRRPELRAEVAAAVAVPGPARARLLAVLGASTALTDHLVAHPEHWRAAAEAVPTPGDARRRALLAAVAEPGALTPSDALRVGYREQLLGIAALDLTSEDPTEMLPVTAAALADLADAALEAALAIARDEAGEAASRTRLAVIAMGKTGGRELNYISDVDVIFAAEPADGVSEEEAVAVATDLATRLMRVCSAATAAGSLWQVDPALRPEGKAGPLVRTLASHRSYYERWAKTWEFQALLKARPAAGDREVGAAYCDAVQPMVWQASSRENFVDDVQAMRRRVEQHIPAAEAERQIKLGAGGLRDVEFSVQLLQLVHGRADETLRTATTLEALDALSAGGYVGRDDAATLSRAYRYLRSLEHRIQLHRLRRTHLMPTAEADLRRLGRSLGHRTSPADAVLARWRQERREVRRLHERIFYRPLLSAVARLSDQDVRLTPDAARERLAALGFRDPAGALRHLEALTDGLSRRAAIQRQLLPVMLGWFADEADPDAGLLAFRRISDELGSTHWYLRLLRDEGSAAERLAHTLARSRFAAGLLEQAPECVQFLGDAGGLEPRPREDVLRRMRSAAGRKDDAEAAVLAARTIRRSELFRLTVADLQGLLSLDGLGAAMTDLTAALLEVTLEQCVREVEHSTGQPALTRLLVVGMGRLGGGEQGYGSDADVVFVHDPLPDVDEMAAQHQAMEVVKRLIALLGRPGPDPNLDVDATLRPEGKNGPLVRSLASYREYYSRWSLVWEAQALLRATPLAGDESLAAAFLELVAPLRWPEGGLDPGQVREIRTLKARMEAERLPRGADRKTHFKLGHGGLSDVEWVAQLVQLRHAGEHPELRTTSTTSALAAAERLGLVEPAHADALVAAWRLASSMRNASVLFRGKPVDSVPTYERDADGVARILGLPGGSGQELAERYRRVARRSRAAFEAEFFED